MTDSDLTAPAGTPEPAGHAAAAPWDRVRFAPPESWVTTEACPAQIQAKEGAHTTYLLLARQVNAETGESFSASALRLETPLAVQNQSQWRLDFDPRFQRLTLHWLRVVRGGESIDHAQRDRMRLLQRESQLEHHVLNGAWTLLAVLDGVRTGDTIEAAFTLESRHPISAGWCEVFFAVPPQQVVGRYRLAVRFATGRPGLACLAAAEAPAREEQAGPDHQWWSWSGAQLTLREPESNHPGSYLDYLWIQISDLPGWGALARRVAAQWEAGGAELPALPEFARPATVDPAAVARLIRHLQDDYRYLSVDLATGGWIPAAPAAVARQRFGDCKDLVWLATTILRSWGVPARPVLVGTGFRKGIARLLPMSSLFNHAVLEVDLAGWARWFDLTGRCHGGDYYSQSISLFDYGLPIDPAVETLQEQPHPSMPHQYVLRETILVDTKPDEPSLIEQRYWLNGYHADNFRRARLAQGADGFAEQRLKFAEKRYGKVRRYAPLQWRDDRDRNVCEVIETFAVTGMLTPVKGRRVTYDPPPTIVFQFLSLPPDKDRRTPWHLVYPLEIRHLLTVRGPGMGNRGWRRRKWSARAFSGSLAESRPAHAWANSLRLTVHEPEVDPARVAEFRRQLFDFLKSTSWRLTLPANRSRPKAGPAFGTLPPAGTGAEAYVPDENLSTFPEAVLGQPAKKHWREWVPAAPHRWWRYFLLFWLAMTALGLLTKS